MVQTLRRVGQISKTIWVFRQYSDPPDGHWTNHFELFRRFIKKGYKVTIFSSSFSHFSREDNRLEKGETMRSQIYDGVRFIFIKTTPYFSNNWRRFANFFSYSWLALRIGLTENENPDIIIGCTPHPLGAFVAWYIAKKRNARFFFEVHDLWPQFFIELGAYPEWHPIIKGLMWLEGFLLREAEHILPLWTKMDVYFEKQGISRSKCTWMPMGLDCKSLPVNLINPLSSKNFFTVMYRGRFGMTQDMTTILDAAKLLQETENEKIRFVIVGEGPERTTLEKIVEQNNLKNVIFRNFTPKDQMLEDMSNSDVLLGSLPDLPHFRDYGMISTKLIDYFSSNRPIIFSTSVTDHLIIRSKAGFVVPPEDATALASTIIKLVKMPLKERQNMGINGLNYLREHHDIRVLSDRLEKLIINYKQ